MAKTAKKKVAQKKRPTKSSVSDDLGKGKGKVSPEINQSAEEELTIKQERFCLAYFQCGIATTAYKIAYPVALEWTSGAVEVEASRMLDNPKIILRLSQLRKEAAERAMVTETRALEEAARIAFADPRELYDEHGELLPVHKWPNHVAAMVASIEIEKTDYGTKTKVKTWDKNNALEKVFRHLGLYGQDNKQKAPIVANLDKLPLNVQDMIAEKLHAIINSGRPDVSGQPDQRAGKRITH